MAVELDDLVDRLEASLVAPGSASLFTFSDSTRAGWTSALANAFWNARLAGLFKTYRVEDAEIVPIDDTDPDLPEEVQQVIVVWAAVVAVEAAFMGLADTRYKAGPAEAETKRSATVLKAILDAKRVELEAIKDTVLTGSSTGATTVAFIDLALARSAQIQQGSGYWVN